MTFALVQLEYLLFLPFGIYTWALVIRLHQLLQLSVANTQRWSHRLLLSLDEFLIAFSLRLIILFKLDFPSYCLLLCVVGFALADIARKVGYRKDRMLSILANEGLRGFRCSLILSPDAALELAAH